LERKFLMVRYKGKPKSKPYEMVIIVFLLNIYL
jgi:hypothetical protein